MIVNRDMWHANMNDRSMLKNIIIINTQWGTEMERYMKKIILWKFLLSLLLHIFFSLRHELKAWKSMLMHNYQYFYSLVSNSLSPSHSHAFIYWNYWGFMILTGVLIHGNIFDFFFICFFLNEIPVSRCFCIVFKFIYLYTVFFFRWQICSCLKYEDVKGVRSLKNDKINMMLFATVWSFIFCCIT